MHFPAYVLQNNDVKWPNSAVYSIDTGVLLKNTPLIKFIRNYIRDPSGVFSISSLVKISMTLFPAVSRLFVFGWLFVYIIKRTLHVSSKISKLCSRDKNNISRVSARNQWDRSCHSNIKFISSRLRVTDPLCMERILSRGATSRLTSLEKSSVN